MEEKRKVRTLQFDNKNILTHFKEGKLELAAKAIEDFQINLTEFKFKVYHIKKQAADHI